MIHVDTELRFVSPEIGYGVFATRPIPRGTITWVRDRLDQTLTAEAIERLPPVYHDIVLKCSFVDARGRFVLCWDHARYMNHSCDPTCLSAGDDFEIAIRDIAAGAELTDDYGSLNLDYAFQCQCGSPGRLRSSHPFRSRSGRFLKSATPSSRPSRTARRSLPSARTSSTSRRC